MKQKPIFRKLHHQFPEPNSIKWNLESKNRLFDWKRNLSWFLFFNWLLSVPKYFQSVWESYISKKSFSKEGCDKTYVVLFSSLEKKYSTFQLLMFFFRSSDLQRFNLNSLSVRRYVITLWFWWFLVSIFTLKIHFMVTTLSLFFSVWLLDVLLKRFLVFLCFSITYPCFTINAKYFSLEVA